MKTAGSTTDRESTGPDIGRDWWWPRHVAAVPMSVADQQGRFWLSYLTVTFGIQFFLSVVLIGYLLATPDAGNRGILLGIAALSLALAAVGMTRSRWLATQTWRSGFWLGWLCGSCVAMAVVSSLDGGLTSPLLFMPVLPVMSAMLALSPLRVTLVAGLAVAGLFAVFLSAPEVAQSRASMIVRLALVLSVVLLAVSSAVQRMRLQARQAVLLEERQDVNAQLVAAQELAHVGTLEVDANGDARFSDEMHRITGTARNGSPSVDILRDHIHPDDLQRVLETFLRPAGQGRTVDVAHRLVRDDGEVRDVHSWAATTVDRSGNTKLTGTVQDVTDQRAVERMKDEFLSVISHELRTPLTSIRGALGLLAGGALGPLSADAQRMATIAVSSSDRLVRLVNDILDVERMAAGRVTLKPESCAADELAHTAVQEMAAMAQAATITLEVGEAGGSVWADRDRILQTLTNLIGNAIKFSNVGGQIQIGAAPADGMVVFTVVDHGRGIPAEQLESVFGRFRQVDASDARDKGGAGLGLAICRGIVDQHGGRIWAAGTPGGGATLAFALPADPASTVERPPAVTVVAAGDSAAGTALICDDDPDFVEVMATLLHTHGYPTVRAYNGAQAVELAVRHRPAVVVLDLMMPGMSGWDTLTELRRRPETATIPVVILTVLGPEETPDERVSGWVAKTAGADELLRKLRHAMGTDAAPTVLVVEDDQALAQVLAAVFERRGATTVVTGKGRDALALSTKITPDLMVLDVGLPDIDGFAVVDALRRDDRLRSVPLVVYTGADLSETDRKRLRLGETRFLTKGRVSPAEFERQITGMLGRIGAGSSEAGRPAVPLAGAAAGSLTGAAAGSLTGAAAGSLTGQAALQLAGPDVGATNSDRGPLR